VGQRYTKGKKTLKTDIRNLLAGPVISGITVNPLLSVALMQEAGLQVAFVHRHFAFRAIASVKTKQVFD
jgi:hypothetical protein